MAKQLMSDELWAVVVPLLPAEAEKPRGGRPRVPDRDVLRGILFVLATGLPWEYLPPEMGCGSGMTCWRRLKAWNDAGVWQQLHRVLLDRLGEADRIDWSRAALDSSSVPAQKVALRPERIRRIAANRARSAIWSSTGRASSTWTLCKSRSGTARMSRAKPCISPYRRAGHQAFLNSHRARAACGRDARTAARRRPTTRQYRTDRGSPLRRLYEGRRKRTTV